MSQQSQQNNFVSALVETQAVAVDSQKKLIAYHENQIRQLSEALTSANAQRDAYKKQVESLQSELLRQRAEQKDNVVEDVTPVDPPA